MPITSSFLRILYWLRPVLLPRVRLLLVDATCLFDRSGFLEALQVLPQALAVVSQNAGGAGAKSARVAIPEGHVSDRLPVRQIRRVEPVRGALEVAEH